MSSTPTTWYIQTQGEPEGPVSLAELKRLACRGVILGDALLSSTGAEPWQPAAAIQELELEWSVQPEQGDPPPACHALALRGWVESGEVQPYWSILHLPSGEMYNVVDTLCSALLTQNKILETRLEAIGPAANLDSSQEGDLGDAIDNLLRSLELKSELLADAYRKIDILQAEREHERGTRETEVKQYEKRLEELTTHLEEMDSAMAALTRNYRDLNDKWLRLRSGKAEPKG